MNCLNKYDDEDICKKPKKMIRILFFIFELLAQIGLGVIGIIIYLIIKQNFHYPNSFFEQQLDSWNKEFITDFMYISRDQICEDINVQWNSYLEYNWYGVFQHCQCDDGGIDLGLCRVNGSVGCIGE